MRNSSDRFDFDRLVQWADWEIPRPGTEAIVGFAIVAAVSLGLHAGVVLLCDWLRGK